MPQQRKPPDLDENGNPVVEGVTRPKKIPEFTTQLTPEEDTKFQSWIKTNNIKDLDHPDSYYDYRGFWKENPNYAHKEGEHFTDKFKQPGHPTFSVESKYAKGRTDAGSWDGDEFVPPDQPPDLDENGNPVEGGVSGFMKNHPRIREMGERLLTGTSPEYEQMLKEHGIPKVLGTPESESSIFPKWKSQPETFVGGFAKSLYNDFVVPQGSPSGIIGSAGFRPLFNRVRARFGNLPTVEEIPIRKELPPARTYVNPEGAAYRQDFGVPRSTEIPYKADIPTVTDITEIPNERQRLVPGRGERPYTAESPRYTPPIRREVRQLGPGTEPTVPPVDDALMERLQSDNPPIIDDQGGTDFIPEEHQPAPVDPTKLQQFLDGVRGATGESVQDSLSNTLQDLKTGKETGTATDKFLKGGGKEFALPPEKPKSFNPFETEKPPDLTAEGVPETSTDLVPKKDERLGDFQRRTGLGWSEAKTKWDEFKAGEKPQFAKSEKGGIKVGQDIRRSAGELTTGYSRPLEGIMVREGMQNAIDAVRHLGEDGRINVKTGDDFIEIADNGKGMNREQLETVFSDLHSSGKMTEAGATGGKGVGKAPGILGGKHFKAETIVFEHGKKIKRTIEGTPEEFMEHVDIKEEEVPLRTPTGTTIRTTLKEGQKGYTANAMLSEVLDHTRGVKALVTRNRYGKEYEAPMGREDDKIIGTRDIDNNDVTVRLPRGVDLSPRSYIFVKYLNNGMFQFEKPHYFEETIPNMPTTLIVDLHPKMEEGTTEYPFPVQRESIKEATQKKIEEFIDEKLAYPELNQRKTKLKELYDAMESKGYKDNDSGRKIMFYDPGNRLTPDERREFDSSPVISHLSVALDNIIDTALNKIGNEAWSERLEGVGIVLDPNMHGVHIPNPTSGKSTILINPFEHIARKDPEGSAAETVLTALHEIAHIGSETPDVVGKIPAEELTDPRVGRYLQSYLSEVAEQGGIDPGHGMAFIKRLGETYVKSGPRNFVEGANAIQEIFTGGRFPGEAGGYNPEVQRLLQIYQESRGREPVVEDFLSGTGAKQATPRGGKRDATGDRKANRERTTPTASAVTNLLEAIKNSKSLRGEQEAIYRKERARRFAASAGVKAEGIKGAKSSLGKMSGEYEKVEGESIGVSAADTDALFTAVKKANITQGERLKGYTALFKILEGGGVPQRSELKVLDDVFGSGFADGVTEMYGGIGAVGIKIGKTFNTMKALMSSMDLSGPLKQGMGLVHKKEWRDAVVEMFKYMNDPKYYDAAMQAIEKRPKYILGRSSGLFLAKPSNLLSGEEAFMNNYISDLPEGLKGLYGREFLGVWERAYVGFLNKLRSDTFDTLTTLAEKAGHTLFTVAEHVGEDGSVSRTIVPSKASENIAKFINISTGRGKLGWAEKIAPELNMLFWSPRLIASRFQSLALPFYPNLDAFTRKEAVKSLFAIAGASTVMRGIAAATGGVIGYKILNSDFLKARFGKQVVDPNGGYGQIVVLTARLIQEMQRLQSGKSKQYGKPGIPELLWNFTVNKFSPAASLIYDVASARQFTGKRQDFRSFSASVDAGGYIDKYGNKKTIPKEIIKRFAPIFSQDVIDVLGSDESLARSIGLDAASFIGIGVQDYPERHTEGPSRMRMRNLRMSP